MGRRPAAAQPRAGRRASTCPGSPRSPSAWGIDGDAPAPDHRAQVGEILSYLEGTATRDDGIPLHAPAAEGADLEVWLLGSSAGVSAQTAGELGLPFAVNYHTIPTTVLDTVEAYRAAFTPSVHRERPHVMVSADVVVAPTDDDAADLAAPYGQWVLDIRTGRGAQPYVTPPVARAREWTDDERAGVADRVDTQFVGSPSTVVKGLETLVGATGADELLITTITTEHADRVRSHELLAEAWAGAEGPPSSAARALHLATPAPHPGDGGGRTADHERGRHQRHGQGSDAGRDERHQREPEEEQREGDAEPREQGALAGQDPAHVGDGGGARCGVGAGLGHGVAFRRRRLVRAATDVATPEGAQG